MTRPLMVAAILLGWLASVATAQEPPSVPLWPGDAPGSEGRTAAETVRLTEQGEHIVSQVHRPSITPYLPSAALATGAAVIVIPGGGHRELRHSRHQSARRGGVADDLLRLADVSRHADESLVGRTTRAL